MNKIIVISHETRPTIGGVSTWIDNLCIGLREAGYEYEIWSKRESEIADVKILPNRFKIHSLIISIIRLRILKKLDRVILVDAGSIMTVFLSVIMGLKIRDLKVVLHGTEIRRLHGFFKKVFLKNNFEAFLKSADVITISDEVSKIAKTIIPALKIRTVYNSTSLELPKILGLTVGDTINILIVGRLDPRKRIDLILKSCRLSSKNINLTVVGRGGNRDVLEYLAGRYLKKEDSIRFLGRVSADELKDLYRQSDIVFVPAGRHNGAIEGFGLTIIEALSNEIIPLSISLDGPGEISKLLSLPSTSPRIDKIANTLTALETASVTIDPAVIEVFTPKFQAKEIIK